MVASATNALDRVLNGFTQSMSVELAKEIAHSAIDADTQLRLNELADKAGSGNLSDSEKSEYLDLVEAIDFVSIFQAKARSVARGQSPQ